MALSDTDYFNDRTMVPFVDLKIQYKAIEKEIMSGIAGVMEDADFILGGQVIRFEEEFAQFCGSKYCVGVASGTDALHIALKALDIGKGDEVITAANTFVATVLAVSYTGAKPVLVDVDPNTYNLDINKVEERITSRTKAIIPVHLYGRAVNMEDLLSLANKYNLKVVEDACQAHGANFNGGKAGSFGVMGCFSFYPGKNLGAYGDGGAVVTSDEGLYNKLKMLRNYGSIKKYYHDITGYNSRLDTIQAAVLRVKLRYLEDWNSSRIKNAKFYNEKLKETGDLILPGIDDGFSHVFHLYVVRTEKRDELLSFLKENGVQCGIHYPVPIYSLGAYSYLGYCAEDFPVTERFSKQILSLPMFPELTELQVEKTVNAIKRFYEERLK